MKIDDLLPSAAATLQVSHKELLAAVLSNPATQTFFLRALDPRRWARVSKFLGRDVDPLSEVALAIIAETTLVMNLADDYSEQVPAEGAPAEKPKSQPAAKAIERAAPGDTPRSDADQTERGHEAPKDESPARRKPKKSKCSPEEWQVYRKRVLAGDNETLEVMSLELVAVRVDMSEWTILRMLDDPASKLKRVGAPSMAGTSSKRKIPSSGRVMNTRKSYNECIGQTGK